MLSAGVSIPVYKPAEVKDFNNWLQGLNARGVPKVEIFGQKYDVKKFFAKKLDPKYANLKTALADQATPKGNLSDSEMRSKEAEFRQISARLDEIKTKVEELDKAIKAAKDSKDKKKQANLEKQKAVVVKKKEALVKRLKSIATNLKQYGKRAKLTREQYTKAGVTPPKHLQKEGDVSKAKMTVKSSPQQAPSQQKSGSKKTLGNAKAQTGSWGLGSNWGGQTMTGPKFSTAAYAQSLLVEGNIMDTWDNINSNQNRGQQLMMILFYYMRMAMSGDLGAMYNMMKAVLYIIAKDKALQQIHASELLIKLQDESRRATDQLLNFQASSDDPGNIEFTKVLQQTKSQTDAIATSQKLVAQMMEEMAQIVETLTNVVKGAFDSWKRTSQVMSRPV